MFVDPSSTHATVTGAIRQAARVTGADFQYLLATAQVESNFNPNARVATSSARGLFQFIQQTWLQTLKEQGPALGYGPYADAIERRPSGQYVVTDPRMHGTIMNLRSDPTANAVMAGAFTRANAKRLAGALGRAPTEGELYIAHFLGASGANRLIGLAQSQPETTAAAAFPGAAQANRSIFYDRTGRARSAEEVYRALTGRYQFARDRGPGLPAVASMVAGKQAPARWRAVALDPVARVDTYPVVASAKSPVVAGRDAPARGRAIALDPVARADTYPVVASTAPPVAAGKGAQAHRPTVVAAAAASVPAEAHRIAARAPSRAPAAGSRETSPIFHGLFRTDGSREPLAPVVSALWSVPEQAPPPRPAAAPRSSTDPASGTLDLFQDLRPGSRAPFRGRV
jgi:hypothetical protein